MAHSLASTHNENNRRILFEFAGFDWSCAWLQNL
jgi:hypothetical protein